MSTLYQKNRNPPNGRWGDNRSNVPDGRNGRYDDRNDRYGMDDNRYNGNIDDRYHAPVQPRVHAPVHSGVHSENRFHSMDRNHGHKNGSAPRNPGLDHMHRSNGMENRAYAHSRQSLASIRSTKSTKTTRTTRSIQSEYQNHRTHKKIRSWYYGQAKRPFRCAIGFIVIGVLLLVVGFTLLGLEQATRLRWGYKGMYVIIIIIALGLLFMGVSLSFCWETKKMSDKERTKIVVSNFSIFGTKM